MKKLRLPKLLLVSFVLTACQNPVPPQEPSGPQWSFNPPPRGSFEFRVPVVASAGPGRSAFLSMGGDPRTSGTPVTGPVWLGTSRHWSLNWSTPVGSGWDTVRSTTYRITPNRPQAAAGVDHNLVIESTSLWAWGHGTNGQLGQGDGPGNRPSTQATRVLVPHDEAVVGVWAAGDNSAFVDELGSLWVFGYGTWLDTVGYRGPTGVPLRVPLPEKTRAVSASLSDLGGVYAIDQVGGLWVWGVDGHFAFGRGGGASTELRTPEKVLDGVALVSAAPYHALALKTDGTLWVAGRHHGSADGYGDEYNRLGTGASSANALVWTLLGTWTDALTIGAAEDHSWLLTEAGDLWVWGANSFGQLPGVDPAVTRVDVPTKTQTKIAAVGGGTRFLIVIPEVGPLQSWGEAPGNHPSLTAGDGIRSIQGGTAHAFILTAAFHDAAADPWAGLRSWGEHLK